MSRMRSGNRTTSTVVVPAGSQNPPSFGTCAKCRPCEPLSDGWNALPESVKPELIQGFAPLAMQPERPIMEVRLSVASKIE
jgi:hypothetical protein